MEKERKYISKVQNIIIIILVISVFLSLTFFNEIDASDELWTFQNSSKLYNGYLIYKDANVITTPMFFYIAAGLFKIFGGTFLVYRCFNILIYFFMLMFIYKIFRNLKISKHVSILGIAIIFFEITSLYNVGANYNVLAIVFSLIGINLYISKNHNPILHGIVMALVFLTKQNIGIFYIMAEIACDLYLKGFNKDFFVKLIKKFFVFFLLTLIIILKLYFDNVIYDFINYAFGSLFEFGQKNLSFSADFQYAALFVITFILYIIILWFIKLKKNEEISRIIDNNKFENLTILIIFTFFISILIYPIANTGHFQIVLPLHMIFIIYFLNISILDDFCGSKKYSYIAKWLLIIIMIGIDILCIIHYFQIKDECTFITNKSSIFSGFMISDKYIEKKENLEKYITEKNSEGIDVIVISYDSGFFMTELKQSHGVYDLLFYGNMGYNGEENVKEDILNKRNTEFLVVTKEEDIFEQESVEIRNFVMENLIYEGTIENYSIYSTQK